MKKTKNYLFPALLIPFMFALVASGVFSGCNDKETPTRLNTLNAYGNKAIQYVEARDYQIDIVEDSLLIFDGNRFVGAVPFNWDKPSPVDSLIMMDNE